MKMQIFQIDNIPSVLYGAQADKVILAVHGNQSSKTDVPIRILAETAQAKGYQVLSFDLPEHGERKGRQIPCKVQNCVEELKTVMEYVKGKWKSAGLFACSMGAYFSLLAYRDEKIEKCLFLSPVVDMGRLIENMMTWFHVTPEQLEASGELDTPIGQKLYWDYYCYTREHPIEKWNVPTYILYGNEDDLCEYDRIKRFTEQFACSLEVVERGEHYFHTKKQLERYRNWLQKEL
ncbi:alpha/beta hydrolase [Blautia pseudococcoides]|uniref:Alpha/beta hydrolase n=2 Tax=Blautia pseudococcoides TaxID=1796616 RepID=A0A1C7IA58_9FIRM|nr:alpha/beta hydrolase [Blautia pseudococcoides]ANU76570.1 alpha/beta hydrolase [Blautia pseudococcoides]ASU29378.1 alpha/beta hydrolase [Blautia pseudococcoides]QJU13211.1 alpha/beta hydrolase [Blautia pseudococcoides]QQQ94147.1 alpha/beta hydrolase [Blautia pseudococcoides]